MTWIAAAQMGLSYLNQRAATDAANERLRFEKRQARPGMLGREYLASRIGKESRALGLQYQDQAERTSRLFSGQRRKSRMYWSTGGRAGGRGDEFRIADKEREIQGGLALDYASRQEQSKVAPAMALAGQGAGGVSEAFAAKGATSGLMYQDFAAMLGDYQGYRRARDVLGTPDSGGDNNTPPPPGSVVGGGPGGIPGIDVEPYNPTQPGTIERWLELMGLNE